MNEKQAAFPAKHAKRAEMRACSQPAKTGFAVGTGMDDKAQ
jgi:hypothetical protein